jgi:hypothetical protein
MLIPLKILVDQSFPLLRMWINFGFYVSKIFTQRTQRESQRNNIENALCDLCVYLAFFARNKNDNQNKYLLNLL